MGPLAGKLVLVTGGARSGKSRFAENLAASLGDRVVYVATARPGDEEMAQRIARHRARRPAWWETVEEERDVAGVVAGCGYRAEVVLVDCLAVLVSNLLLHLAGEGVEDPDEATASVLEEVSRLVEAASCVPATVILVTNEVGMGIVPEYPLGRLYRDVLGLANQAVARSAGEVYLVCAGIPVELKRLGGGLNAWPSPDR